MNLPAEVANWRLIVLAAALTLPLFIVLNGASVSLPESSFLVSGIPVHASALLFLLLPKRFLMRPIEIFFLLVYLIYCVIALLDSGERLQMTIQLGYFIYGYKILRELGPETIRTLNLYIAVIGSAFICIHVISMGQAMMSGNFLAAGDVFGFVIYQSHLTYPIVLTLILVSVYRSFGHQPVLRLVIITLVMLIELVLLRRVGTGIFLIFLFLFERRSFIFLVLAILASSIIFKESFEVFFEIIPSFDRLTRILGTDGSFTRSMTWERSLSYLNEVRTIMVGNGKHNHSHNFFLQTITTHGLIIAMFFFAPVIYWVYLMTVKNGFFNRYSFLAFAIVAVDWNLNVNLHQPYYSSMFAFFLVSCTILNDKGQNGQ